MCKNLSFEQNKPISSQLPIPEFPPNFTEFQARTPRDSLAIVLTFTCDAHHAAGA
jgi:hypothetical protein